MYKFEKFKDAYVESRKYNVKGKMADFPPYVTFELLDVCNFRCIMCPATYFKSTGKELDYGLFKMILDEISQYKSLIRFIGYCEPLLCSYIKDAIRCVKSRNLLLHITTNGSLLDKEIIKTVVDSKIDCIIFSFQGLTEEEYCFMRNVKPDIYSKVIDNIKLLYNSRRDNKPYIKLTTTISERDSLKDKDKFVDNHLDYADEIQITGFTHFIPLQQCFGRTNIWTELKINRPEKIDNISCFVPNYELLIKASGNVHPCCGVFNDNTQIGKIGEDSLFNIWHSKEADKIREAVSNGNLEKFQSCIVCPIRYKYKNIGNTVTNARRDLTEKFYRDKSYV